MTVAVAPVSWKSHMWRAAEQLSYFGLAEYRLSDRPVLLARLAGCRPKRSTKLIRKGPN